MTSNAKLEQIANKFWQDFKQNNTISTGVAYQKQLFSMNLDESIESLRLLDEFLLKVNNHTNKQLKASQQSLTDAQKLSFFLKDEKFRKMVLFVAVYTSKVLAKAWQSDISWFDKNDLQKIDEALTKTTYYGHSLAIKFADDNKIKHLQTTQVNTINQPWLFFVLEPILQQLFFNTQSVSAIQTHNTIENSLYVAVFRRLPKVLIDKLNLEAPVSKAEQTSHGSPLADVSKSHVSQDIQQTAVVQPTTTDINQKTNKQETVSPVAVDPNIKKQLEEIKKNKPVEPITTKATKTVIKKRPNVDYSSANNQLIVDALEKQILNVDDSQTTEQEAYLKASTVMQKFDEHFKKSKETDTPVNFSDEHKKIRQQALVSIKKCADAGNTNAMLHIANYLIQGQWIPKNADVAASYVQKAANIGDARGMQILSKMYYQGFGVAQDLELGKHWIEKAADAGHEEAKAFNQEILLAKTMIQNDKKLSKDDKNLTNIMLVVIGVAAFIFILDLIFGFAS